MKKNILFLLSFFAISISYSQYKVDIDQRLLSVFPQEKLEYLQQSSPKELAFMNFMLDHALEVVEESAVSISDENLSVISINDINEINFYALKVSQQLDTNSYYIIEGTDLILEVKSYKSVKEMFKNEFYKDK
jgi:hypothetical protein